MDTKKTILVIGGLPNLANKNFTGLVPIAITRPELPGIPELKLISSLTRKKKGRYWESPKFRFKKR